MTRHILMTGCSGGGKSTLADALAKRGHSVVPEPGLRIVNEERERGGSALPWGDMLAFLLRAVEMARADLTHMAREPHPVFYDRGAVLDLGCEILELPRVDLPTRVGIFEGAFCLDRNED